MIVNTAEVKSKIKLFGQYLKNGWKSIKWSGKVGERAGNFELEVKCLWLTASVADELRYTHLPLCGVKRIVFAEEMFV